MLARSLFAWYPKQKYVRRFGQSSLVFSFEEAKLVADKLGVKVQKREVEKEAEEEVRKEMC